MSEEAKDKTPETPAPAPQPPAVSSPSDSPKKILEALEKDAAGAVPPPKAVPEPQPPVSPPAPETAAPEPSPAIEASAVPAEVPTPDVVPAAPVTAPISDAPLITDAMRRLDELLARFKQSS